MPLLDGIRTICASDQANSSVGTPMDGSAVKIFK